MVLLMKSQTSVSHVTCNWQHLLQALPFLIVLMSSNTYAVDLMAPFLDKGEPDVLSGIR